VIDVNCCTVRNDFFQLLYERIKMNNSAYKSEMVRAIKKYGRTVNG
jgi:hypothetical protein